MSSTVNMSTTNRGGTIPSAANVSKARAAAPQFLRTSQLRNGGISPLILPPASPKIVQFLNMADYTFHTASIVPVDQPIFQPLPGVVTFESCEPFHTAVRNLSLRNNDAVARRVKIEQPDSPYFSVELVTISSATKVAPGIEITYAIKFTPQDRADLTFDLIVVTEREKFSVPVRVIGSRPLISFPDDVVFEKGPVHANLEKTILVRNEGDRAGSVNLFIAPPFKVEPSFVHLGVNQAAQVCTPLVC